MTDERHYFRLFRLSWLDQMGVATELAQALVDGLAHITHAETLSNYDERHWYAPTIRRPGKPGPYWMIHPRTSQTAYRLIAYIDARAEASLHRYPNRDLDYAEVRRVEARRLARRALKAAASARRLRLEAPPRDWMTRHRPDWGREAVLRPAPLVSRWHWARHRRDVVMDRAGRCTLPRVVDWTQLQDAAIWRMPDPEGHVVADRWRRVSRLTWSDVEQPVPKARRKKGKILDAAEAVRLFQVGGLHPTAIAERLDDTEVQVKVALRERLGSGVSLVPPIRAPRPDPLPAPPRPLKGEKRLADMVARGFTVPEIAVGFGVDLLTAGGMVALHRAATAAPRRGRKPKTAVQMEAA